MRTMLGMALCAMVALGTGQAYAQDRTQVLSDALSIMGASLTVPGLAAYCNKFIRPNPALITAAAAWNDRNEGAMLLVIKAIEWSGGMSASVRKGLDVAAYDFVKVAVEADNGAICTSMLGPISDGSVDIETWSETSEAYRRLRDALP